MLRKTLLATLLAVLCSADVLAQTTPAEAQRNAQRISAVTGLSRGLCCVVLSRDSSLPAAFTQQSSFLVHALYGEREALREARKSLAMPAHMNSRLVVDRLPPKRLPYPDNSVDLAVVDSAAVGWLQDAVPGELARVLRPGGKAVFSSYDVEEGPPAENLGAWEKQTGVPAPEASPEEKYPWPVFTKARPPGMDDWTHWEHGPDNNPVSKDAFIAPPYNLQWLGRPYYVAMPSVTLAAGGRIFTATGHIAHHRREEPWLNSLLAQNGHNGTALWRKHLPDGYLVHRSAFVATADRFYMIDGQGAACLVLDPETGEERGRIRIAEAPGQWKWLALQDEALFALLGETRDPADTTIVRNEERQWRWVDLSPGYYQARHPWGKGTRVVRYGLAAGQVDWMHESPHELDSRYMAISGDRLYVGSPEKGLAALNLHTGEMVWSNTDEEILGLLRESGMPLPGFTGFVTAVNCLCTPDAIIYHGQNLLNLVALAPEDGRLLWRKIKGVKSGCVLYHRGSLIANTGAEGAVQRLDPLTGDLLEDWSFAKKNCAKMTATEDSVFCRGFLEGTSRYDVEKGTLTLEPAYRPGCTGGMVGANGLLYVTPWLCDCNLSLVGTIALRSARGAPPQAPDTAPLEWGEAHAREEAPLDTSPLDWTHYRGNVYHTGSSPVRLPQGALRLLWRQLPVADFVPTPTTAAGDLVFLGGSDGIVRAFESATGRLRWRFVTSGPVMSPPSLWKNRAYVGSGDGFVYCLDAASGNLIWRCRAAPAEERIMVYGHLSSRWPVHTGVALAGGEAYFAAGLIDHDGTYVWSVDAETGETRWVNGSSGHLFEGARKGVSALGGITLTDDTLWMAGGNAVSAAPFDRRTGAYKGVKKLEYVLRTNPGEEMALFQGSHILVGGRLMHSPLQHILGTEPFRLLPADDFMAQGGMLAPPAAAGPTVPVWNDDCIVLVPRANAVPAAYDSERFLQPSEGDAASAPSQTPRWTAQALADRKTVALALAANVAVAVTQSDSIPPWSLSLLDAATGELHAEHEITSEPRPNGVSLTRSGQILVVLLDGTLLCFGEDTAA